MAGLRGPTVKRSNPAREDRRGLAGKFSYQRSSQLDGHQNRSAEVTVRLSGGAAFANARCSGSTARELSSGVIARRWRDAAVRGRGFCARLLAVPTTCSTRLLRSPRRRAAGVSGWPDRGAGQAFRSDATRSGGDERESRSARNRRRRRRGWIHDQRTPTAAGPRRAKARPNAASPSWQRRRAGWPARAGVAGGGRSRL